MPIATKVAHFCTPIDSFVTQSYNYNLNIYSKDDNMRAKFFYLLLFTAFFVSGCVGHSARGIKISELNIPMNDGEKTQIIVFMENHPFGSSIIPNVIVNGKVTGTCISNGAFIVNVEEGVHTLLASAENTAVLTTTVKRGETKLIKCELGPGFIFSRVYLTEYGQSVINNSVFTGEY